MSFIKRFTQILTPPPGSVTRQTNEIPTSDAPVAANILPLLVELLQDRSLPPDELRMNLAQLKQIACDYGLAWTAGDILDSIERLPDTQNGVPLKKERGYELAADFYRQIINQEVQTIGGETNSLDRDKFTATVKKFMDCKFGAEKYTQGIGAIFSMVDTLILKSCDVVTERSICLYLATHMISTVQDWSSEKQEFLEQQFNRRRRQAAQFGKEASDEENRLVSQIDTSLILHLKDTQAEIEFLARGIERLTTRPTIPFDRILESEFASERNAQATYLNGIVDLLNTGGPAVLRASILHLLGTLYNAEQRGAGTPAFLAATKIFEQQADVELNLGLGKLAGTRVTYALALAEKTGRADDIGRVKSRLEQFQSPQRNSFA